MSETKQTDTFKSSSSSSAKKKPSAPSDSPPPSRSPSPASSPSSSPCPSPTPDRKDENWVQCDLCQKWRRLPLNVDTSRLPERWFCDMNRWDSARNSCAAPEEGVEAPPPHSSSTPITAVVWSGMPKCFIGTEDRQRFFSILIKFLQSSGQFHRLGRFPNVGKKPLDLYVLYLGVIRMGGMDQIIEKTGWRPISELFNFPPTTTSSGNSLMKNYRKYLYTFEKRYMADHTAGSHHWGHGSLTNLRAANWNNDTTYEQMTDHHSKSSPHSAAARQRRKMRKAAEEADGEDGIDILSQVIDADTALTRGVSNNSTASSRHGGKKRHQNHSGLRVRTDLVRSGSAEPELSPDSSLATFDSGDDGEGRDYNGEDVEEEGDGAEEELEPVPLKRSKSNEALPVSRSRMMQGVRGRNLSRETSDHSQVHESLRHEEDKTEEQDAAYYEDEQDVDMTTRHPSVHTYGDDNESLNAEDPDDAQLPRYHSSLTIEVTEAAARTPTGRSHPLLHSRDKTASLTGRDSSGWPLSVLPLSSSFSVASVAAATLATSSRIMHQPSPSHSLGRHMVGVRPLLTPSPPSSPGGLPAQWSPDSIGSSISSNSAHPRADSLMDPIHLSGTRICSLEELLQRLDDRIRCEDEMLKRVDQISAVLQKRIQGVRDRAKAYQLEDVSESTHSPRSVDF